MSPHDYIPGGVLALLNEVQELRSPVLGPVRPETSASVTHHHSVAKTLAKVLKPIDLSLEEFNFGNPLIGAGMHHVPLSISCAPAIRSSLGRLRRGCAQCCTCAFNRPAAPSHSAAIGAPTSDGPSAAPRYCKRALVVLDAGCVGVERTAVASPPRSPERPAPTSGCRR